MSIVVKNLTKKFDSVVALKNINLSFKENKITGLIGFNGSGKTTTFNILVNFIEKYKGSFTINDKPLDGTILKTISYLSAGAEPKNSQKVLSHFLSISSLYNIPKKEAILKINELSKKIELTSMLNMSIKSLSKGNQQKLKIVTALLNPNIKFLFLDEPFDGLDPIMTNKIKKIFMDLKNITIIITSHRMEIIDEMCDEFYVLKNGELVEHRKDTDKSIVMIVNPEIKITKIIEKLDCVVSIEKTKEFIFLKISEIAHFKRVNKFLMDSKGYIHSSLSTNREIANAVFKRYSDE